MKHVGSENLMLDAGGLEACSVEDIARLRVNLRLWKVFHVVVSSGSFAGAAEVLHLSQPAVSYAIAQLEEALDIKLLELKGRRSQITQEGARLLEYSQNLLRNAIELQRFAAELKESWKVEIRLMVEHGFPSLVLGSALDAFSRNARGMQVSVLRAPRTDIEPAMRAQSADLAIHARVPDGFRGELLMKLEYVPVAHRNHRLFKLDRSISQEDLAQEVQVLPSSCAPLLSQASFAPGDEVFWDEDTLDKAQHVLREGLAFGWLPKQQAEQFLRCSEFGMLPLPQGLTHSTRFYLVYGENAVPRRIAKQLAETLHQCSQELQGTASHSVH